MSSTATPAAATTPATPAATGPRRAAGRAALWARVALAAALLAGSFAVRHWQGLRVDAAVRSGRLPPFPPEELPIDLGPWKGSPEALDPQIARGTGSTGHTFRTYVDDRTGVRLGVIVLYGPATDVFIHSPDNCYPAQGYTLVEGPALRKVAAAPGREVDFNSMVYARGEGGDSERQEVYYSWYYGGGWSPGVPAMKQAERIPGMLKVHVSRRVVDGEYRLDTKGAGPVDNPCEDFLALLMPEIQRRLDAVASGARAPGPAATPAAPPAAPR